MGETVHETGSFCLETEGHYLVSENCKGGKKCAAKKIPKVIPSTRDLIGQVGSPGHRLCHLWGGRPQIIQYKLRVKTVGKTEGEWVDTSRCLFAQDQSFVEIDYLFYLLEH